MLGRNEIPSKQKHTIQDGVFLFIISFISLFSHQIDPFKPSLSPNQTNRSIRL